MQSLTNAAVNKTELSLPSEPDEVGNNYKHAKKKKMTPFPIVSVMKTIKQNNRIKKVRADSEALVEVQDSAPLYPKR